MSDTKDLELFENQRTGHWIKREKKSMFAELFVCSDCRALCGTNQFKYCPNCGAKMK